MAPAWPLLAWTPLYTVYTTSSACPPAYRHVGSASNNLRTQRFQKNSVCFQILPYNFEYDVPFVHEHSDMDPHENTYKQFYPYLEEVVNTHRTDTDFTKFTRDLHQLCNDVLEGVPPPQIYKKPRLIAPTTSVEGTVTTLDTRDTKSIVNAVHYRSKTILADLETKLAKLKDPLLNSRVGNRVAQRLIEWGNNHLGVAVVSCCLVPPPTTAFVRPMSAPCDVPAAP